MVKFYDLQAITAMHADEYKAAIARVIDSGWFLQGHANQQFEAHYSKYIGTNHCIGVANGLDALYLLLRGYKAGWRRDYRASQHIHRYHYCYYTQQFGSSSR